MATFSEILKGPCFIVNVPELSSDRIPFVTNNVKNAGYTDIRLFNGVNATNPDILNKEITDFGIKFHSGLSSGIKGCFLSHLKLYKHIVDNVIPIATIFEDDAFFHPMWHEMKNVYYECTPKNFDIIFMGNQTEHTNTAYINSLSCYCTHAYIITFIGAQKMLKLLTTWDYNNPNVHKFCGHPIDGLFPIDIIINNIQTRINNKNMRKYLNWYNWNGTMFPCQYNKLPLTGFQVRNCGLVFQSNEFDSIVGIN
jgi:GR25 family glycosyltransferase involved in LPS biosynthesis